MYAIFCLCACVHARKEDPIAECCEPPCGCWELNSGPLEEQAMLLTAEPSLQPPILILYTLEWNTFIKISPQHIGQNKKLGVFFWDFFSALFII